MVIGDYVQLRADPVIELAEKYFKQLKATYGIYGVLGNHDYKGIFVIRIDVQLNNLKKLIGKYQMGKKEKK